MNPTRTIIVVPCYNEADRLDTDAFQRFAASHEEVSFCFVNDGSSDSTGGVLRELVRTIPYSSVLEMERNCGKAEAVRRGLLAAIAERPRFVGYWDADLATPLDMIPRFTEELEVRPSRVMVMGARVQLLGRLIRRSPARHYSGRVIATMAALALRLPVYDTQCGAKLLRADVGLRDALEKPFRSRWLFDVELIARLRRLDNSPAHSLFFEYPLPEWREVPGSKIKLYHGLAAMVELSLIWMERVADSRTGVSLKRATADRPEAP